MLQELDGKVAVITGGGSGIGASLARACASAGMRVVVVDVNEERATAVAAELPSGTAVARAVDVADADSVQALADFAFDTFGAVHLLCNNAGISPVGRVWDFTDDEWRPAARRQPARRGQRHPELRAPHDRAGRGPRRQHRLRRELRGDTPPRALLRDQARDRRSLRSAPVRARRDRHRRERPRPGGCEHQHRRRDGPTVGDRPRPGRGRLHDPHRCPRPHVARHDRTRRGRRRHAGRRARGVGLHRDGSRTVGRRGPPLPARSSPRTSSARSAFPSSPERELVPVGASCSARGGDACGRGSRPRAPGDTRRRTTVDEDR